MTQTAQHTPGPWMIDPDKPTEICVAEDGAMIASTDFFGDGAATAVEANARLIATAPDMLALLKRINEAFYVHGTHKALLPVMAETKPLIRKAEGREP